MRNQLDEMRVLSGIDLPSNSVMLEGREWIEESMNLLAEESLSVTHSLAKKYKKANDLQGKVMDSIGLKFAKSLKSEFDLSEVEFHTSEPSGPNPLLYISFEATPSDKRKLKKTVSRMEKALKGGGFNSSQAIAIRGGRIMGFVAYDIGVRRKKDSKKQTI